MEIRQKILVPTNFSGCSTAALNFAVFLTGELNAVIHLTHVMTIMGDPFVPKKERKHQHRKQLEQEAAYWRGKGVLIETHLLKGEPSTQITEIAEGLQCDLIVMGLPFLSRIKDRLMTSTVESVIRSTVIPVFTVKDCPQIADHDHRRRMHRGVFFDEEWGEIGLNLVDLNQ